MNKNQYKLKRHLSKGKGKAASQNLRSLIKVPKIHKSKINWLLFKTKSNNRHKFKKIR
jgi:hypothetical protein